jgi:hypothetical protein
MALSSKKLTMVEHKELYQQVFSTDAGKLVLSDICHRFGIMRSTTPDMSDGAVRYEEGQRNVALFILGQVDYDINKLRQLREQHKLEITNE